MMDSLQQMQAESAVRCFRGLESWVDATNLVPGDVVVLDAGDKVPADVRIIKCAEGTEVDNAALTGESVPEPRVTAVEPASMAQLEARNMAFLGTTVVKGRLTAVVASTGDSTALGSIAQSISNSRPISSLEMQIE